MLIQQFFGGGKETSLAHPDTIVSILLWLKDPQYEMMLKLLDDSPK